MSAWDLAFVGACAGAFGLVARHALRRDWSDEGYSPFPWEGGTALENTSEVVYNVHSPERCAGRPCSIHLRTAHPMRSFPQHFRGDRGTMERICPHGVGHPDPDDMAWRVYRDDVHGCDGCCAYAEAAEEARPTEDDIEAEKQRQAYDVVLLRKLGIGVEV